MKKLEIIIRPERLDDLKNILNNNGANGLMITNIYLKILLHLHIVNHIF